MLKRNAVRSSDYGTHQHRYMWRTHVEGRSFRQLPGNITYGRTNTPVLPSFFSLFAPVDRFRYRCDIFYEKWSLLNPRVDRIRRLDCFVVASPQQRHLHRLMTNLSPADDFIYYYRRRSWTMCFSSNTIYCDIIVFNQINNPLPHSILDRKQRKLDIIKVEIVHAVDD